MTARYILIVEDDTNDSDLLSRALVKADSGCHVKVLNDSELAIDFLSDSQVRAPSLVVTDLKMPKKTGFELIEWIRSQPRLAELPVVVMSSSKEKSDIDRAMGLRANAYFKKPLGLDELQVIAQTLVGKQTD